MKLVPFSIGDIWAGFGECKGLLKDEGDNLLLEFQITDSVTGILKSDVKAVRVARDDLVGVTVTRGWLGKSWLGIKIIIQTSDMETLKEVPGMSQGRVELKIARKDADDAEKLFANFFKDAERA